MIELKEFKESDFELFISWISTKEELLQFAGSLFDFPVTKRQLLDYVEHSDRQAMKVVLQETQESIGHCELNFSQGKARLSRILIGNKAYRGQGIGQMIVKEMVQLFFQDPAVKSVDLNVFDWNKGAISCYEKVGFKIRAHNEPKLYLNENESWTRLNMVLHRDDVD